MSSKNLLSVKIPQRTNDWPLSSPNTSQQPSPNVPKRTLNGGAANGASLNGNGNGSSSGAALPAEPVPDSTPARKLPVEPSVRKVLRTIRMLATFSLIIGGFLVLNCYQLLLWCTVKPFSSRLYRAGNTALCSSWVHVLMLWMDRLAGNSFYVSGDRSFWLAPQRSSIIMCNHISYGDWPVMFMVAFRAGVSGWLRVVLKEVGKYMPGLGWACWFHEFLFLRRAWDQDSGPMTQRIASFVAERTPLWIMIFPEGTFTDTASPQIVHDAHQFSDKAGLPRRRHTLIPRVKGFSVLRHAGPDDYLSRVVDITLVFTGQSDPTYCHDYSSAKPLLDRGRVLPDVLSFLNAQSPDVHVHVRVFESRDLPIAEADLKRWLFDRFAEKERLIAHFHANGAFPASIPSADGAGDGAADGAVANDEPTKWQLSLPLLVAHQIGWFAAAYLVYTAVGAVLPTLLFKGLCYGFGTILVLAVGAQAMMR